MEELQRLWRAPLPLRISVLIGAVHFAVAVATGGADKPGAAAIAFVFVFIVLFWWLLLKGNRVVWTLLTALGAFTLLSAPFLGPKWWTVLLTAVDLALYLAPSSFEYVWDRPLPFPRTRPR